MDWTKYIDGYCERVDPSYWSEPVNAVSNIAFIIAAALALREARARGALDAGMAWLIFLVTVTGVGSYLFHTHAQMWAAMADTTPIMLFILSYLALSMRRYFGLSWWAAGGITVGFLLLSSGFRPALGYLMDYPYGMSPFNGSEGYFPAFIALMVVGWILRRRDHPAALWIGGTAFIFAVSLTFRTMDNDVCYGFPLGTHFMWHILNGVVLGTLLIAMIRHGKAPAPLAPRATGG